MSETGSTDNIPESISERREMSDEDIIGLFFARSESAITETDRKYGAYCRVLTFNITGSREDSEECVNDTYMKLWSLIPPQRPPKLGAFTARIARSIALNVRKAKNALKRRAECGTVSFEELAECLPSRESVERTADGRAAVEAIERFLSGCSREKQLIFVLRYWYLRSSPDIADALGITEGKVKVTLSRMREKLKAFLESEGIDI